MTDLEFKVAFAPMIAHVGKQPTAEQLRYWHEMLDDLGAEAARRAIVVTLRDYQYAGFPPVGVVRKNAGASQGALQTSDRSMLAWAVVKSAIATVGGYRSIQFDDPIVTASIRALGGWERFCDCEAGEKFDVWLRKEFEQVYRALLASGVDAEQTAPLAGLIEIDRSRDGYGLESSVPLLAETVRTRLPRLPGTVVRGHLEEHKPLAITGPVAEYVDSLGIAMTPPEEPTNDAQMTKRRAELELEVMQLRQSRAGFRLPESITDPKAKPFTEKGEEC
jgi:hypothetical protein